MKNYVCNMFASIQNGQTARKSVISQTRKFACEQLLTILWNENFILGYGIDQKNNKKINIFLKYQKNGEPSINSIKPVSKPGKKIYYSLKQIWKIDSSRYFIIFSTNKGFKSITQCKKLRIGGEPIAIIN